MTEPDFGETPMARFCSWLDSETYEKVSKAVERKALRFRAVIDPQDLVQDAFFALIMAIRTGRYRPEIADFSHFLMGTVNHLLWSALREARRARSVCFTDLEPLRAGSPSRVDLLVDEHLHDQPEAASEYRDLQAHIQVALGQLPRHEALALKLYYLEGKRWQEAATEMGVEYANFRQILSRARKHARPLM